MQRIKTSLQIFLVSFGVFFICASSVHAEVIHNFSERITVSPDASIFVQEKINYDFEGAVRHGIFRTIPLQNAKGDAIKIEDISVTDETGQIYQFTKSITSGVLTIKIGDPNTTLTGAKEYNISYRVKGAIGYFKEYDEIYWNVTGNEWQVAIETAGVQVSLPNNIHPVQQACYVGIKGSTATCETMVNGSDGGLVFTPKGILHPGEGMTVAVGFPKGVVPVVTVGRNWKEFIPLAVEIIFACFLAIVIRFLYVRRWKTGVVIAQYEPPAETYPFLIGSLIDEKVDVRDITAGIITLASLGVLSIKKIDKKNIFSKKDFEITLLRLPSDSAIHPVEHMLVELIFGVVYEVGKTCLLSSLQKNAVSAEKIEQIKKSIGAEMVTKGYYLSDPFKTKVIIASVGFFIIFFVSEVGNFLGEGTIAILIGVIGVILLVSSRGLTKKTDKARGVHRYLLGFKEFLSVTEKDRLDFHNAPERKPETFFALLPYAIALGVEKKWAKQFGDIALSAPSWYSSSDNNFTAAVFVSSLGDFGDSLGSHTGTSSGGSGGGGSSGGGGGGGGGGSW